MRTRNYPTASSAERNHTKPRSCKARWRYFLATVAMGIVFQATGWAGGQSFEISVTTTDRGTLETATRNVDGLPITYPVDEADVVDLLLPAIAKYRALRRENAKEEARAISNALSGEDTVREKLRGQVARVLDLESMPGKEFDASYEAGLEDITKFARGWENWSSDLSALNFWNLATGEPFLEDNRAVFPEISLGANPKDGKTLFAIKSSFLRDYVGIDLLRPPRGENGQPRAIKPFRLDLPLFYRPGKSAERLAAEQREVFETVPAGFRNLALKFGPKIAQSLMEVLLESEIQTAYFTKEAAAAPEGAMMIRGLARVYFLAVLKGSVTGAGENEAQLFSQLMHFDVPETDKGRAEFLRALESLDPIAGKIGKSTQNSDLLFVAGSRILTLTLIKLAQGGEDGGLPPFKKLRKKSRPPEGGFESVARFSEALEDAYPAGFKTTFLKARAEIVDYVKKKFANENAKPAAKEEPAPKVALSNAEPIPGRETTVFQGTSITYPIALKAAIAKFGPELAELMTEARKRVRERFDTPPKPPVPIADSALEMIRRTGLDVTRARADFFSMQVAWLANASRAVVRLFEGNSLQIWFREELVKQLEGGREIAGFSYDPTTKAGVFNYSVGKKISLKEGEPLTTETLKRLFDDQPAPVWPIVLKDRSIADIADVDEQIASIRKADTTIIPRLKAAGSITPAQLGIQGNELSPVELLSPAQTVFLSAHEVVEEQLVRHFIGSEDRRWFCDGVANFLAMRACDEQFGKSGGDDGLKVFESLYNPEKLGARSREVNLEQWPAVEMETEEHKNDKELTHAHYYFATRVLIAATKGRGDDFLKSWISKIRETPRNRTNSATIIAAYDTLTGKSLREIMKKTVSASSR